MNVIAVKTLNDVSPKIGYDYLLNLGFTTLVDNYTSQDGKPIRIFLSRLLLED